MINASKRITQTMLAIHGWSAVCLGLLLYLVIVTGTLVVFEHELGLWANPPASLVQQPLPEGIGARLEALSTTVPESHVDEVAVFPRADGRLMAFFHHHAHVEGGGEVEEGTLLLLDPLDLSEIARVSGPDHEVFAHFGNTAFTDFLLDLHVNLLLPGDWGLLLTGLLGFAMLVAAVSGFVVHRHLLKELFTIRRGGARVLKARDMHVIAGSWSLPFAFVLAFTGAFFSFGGAVGLPVLAAIAFGGDVDSAIEVLQPKVAEDSRPMPLADVDRMLADARSASGSEAQNMLISHWGRADATVSIRMAPADEGLLTSARIYNGATGEFIKQQPDLGDEPSFGGDLAALMTPLHFGNFAGVLSKAVWFGLGAASAYVALSGMVLWTRRREQNRRWRPLAMATVWFAYGLPAALCTTAISFFALSDGVHSLGSALTASFSLAMLASGVMTLFWDNADRASSRMAILNGLLLLCLPISRYGLAGGPGWPAASAAGLHWVIAIDALLFVAALLYIWRGFASVEPSSGKAPQASPRTPTDESADAYRAGSESGEVGAS